MHQGKLVQLTQQPWSVRAMTGGKRDLGADWASGRASSPFTPQTLSRRPISSNQNKPLVCVARVQLVCSCDCAYLDYSTFCNVQVYNALSTKCPTVIVKV